MGRMKLLTNVINKTTNQAEGFCIIKSVQVKSNVKGADYLDLMLADAGGEIVAKLWDYSTAVHGIYAVGDIIKVRGTINMWKDTEQFKVDRIRHKRDAEEVNISDLVATSPVDGASIYDSIYEFVGNFNDSNIARLTQYILRNRKEALASYPAALKLHHAGKGGLMYHTGTMLDVAKKIVEVYKPLYPELSSDLVYCGIILHDVAKTEEYNVSELGIATSYSTRGQLLGHINMGVALVEQAAAELSIPENITVLISHMLLAHHSVPEYGSPKPPMFPEAEIVAELDMLDARLFEMFDAIAGVEIGEFTERKWSMDNRQLYRHGHAVLQSE